MATTTTTITAAASEAAAASITETMTTTTTDDKEDVDDEGLHRDYDVIIVGTGLVQSILAAALSRSGVTPRILHADGADYYGELDAVWTLPYLLNRNLEKQKEGKEEEESIEKGEDTIEEVNNTDGENENCISLSRRGATSSLKIHEIAVHDTGEIRIGTKVSTPFGVGVVTEWTQEEHQEQVTTETETNKTDDNENNDNDNNNKYTRIAIELDMNRPGHHHPGRSFSSSSLSSNNNKNNKHHNNQKTAKTTLYVGIPSSNTAADASSSSTATSNNNNNVRPLREIQAKTILEKHSRSFALDISPCLLFADGPAVTGLLLGNVAEYLEFKALEGVLIYNNNNKSNNNHQFVTVPCSKNSVFRCNYLSPIEKRRLVKFLQLALEYYHASLEEEYEEQERRKKKQEQEKEEDSTCAATDTQKASASAAVLSLNERHLNQGRSLARPQNKALTDLSSLKDCINAQMDLDAYLREKQNLSSKVVDLVRYAMMLETSTSSGTRGGESSSQLSSLSLKEGITSLCKHVHALGRYGTTAFLVPLFGNELSQAFCRCAAVYGTTYLLRRNIIGFVTRKEPDDGTENSPATAAVHEAVLETTQQPSGDEEKQEPSKGTAMKGPTKKRIRCKHLIVPQQALRQQEQRRQSTRRVLRRISILRGKPKLVDSGKNDDNNKDDLLYSSHQQRHLVLFPPKSVADDQRNVIQALLLDEHINVAPHIAQCGCTVVHLTTTFEGVGDDDDDNNNSASNSFLEKALQALLRDTSKDDLDEIFHVTFSYALDEEEDASGSSSAESHSNTKGLHVITRTKQPLVVDDAFEQAQDVFQRICPDHNFLELAEKLKSDIKERLGDAALQNPNEQDDQDERVLAKAMELIQEEQNPESGNSGSNKSKGQGQGNDEEQKGATALRAEKKSET